MHRCRPPRFEIQLTRPAAVEEPESRGLVRTLGLWDVTAITAGTILGSAIFLAAAFVPRAVPHPTLALLLWVTGGLIAIAGALTYAELGTMFPEAGGQYQYIKQAFGPLWGFLFGWTSLLAIQAGANAYLGVAFGEYLGAFMPFFSSTHAIASIPMGPWTWEPNTVQLAGVSAIAVLSTVNYFGTRQGARVQGALTAIKLLSVAGLIGFGLLAPARVSPDWTAPLPAGNLLAAMGLAIVAVLGNFDGWYQATLSAGEIKRPERNLPLGMIGGTVLIGVVYLLVNLVYFRAHATIGDRRVRQDRRRGHDRAARSDGRPAAGGGGSRLGFRLPLVGDHRRVAARPPDVGGRAGVSMDGSDTPSVQDPDGRDRHPRPSGRCCSSCRAATSSCFSTRCSPASSFT